MEMRKQRIILFVIVLSAFFALMVCSTAWAKGIKVLDNRYKIVRLAKDTLFPGVNGATIGADGNLYVVHTGNGSITRIDLKTMKAVPFVRPYEGIFITDDIAADAKGNLYVTGTTPLVGEVYRIDRYGVKTVIASGMTAPNGIEYNPRTQRLFVSECFQADRVFEVDPAGVKKPRLLVPAGVIKVPEGFDFDPESNDLIIPDLATGKILRVNPDSGQVSTVAEKLAAPIALVIGTDKKIYVPSLLGAVYRLSLDGKNLETIAKLPPGLDNAAITKDGRLFVTSYWDATIFEVATDGSGKVKQLFPEGPNQPLGIVVKGDKILVADAIMVRTVSGGRYHQTKLNAWAAHGMPLPLSLANGPGTQVFWTDCINNAVAIGDPATGEFKPVAGGLSQPMSALMSKSGAQLFVAEYAGDQITVVSLKDGSKSVLAKGLEGPIAMAEIEGILYVGEAKSGRISKIRLSSGKKEVFVSSRVGTPLALGNDGENNLLVLDGASHKLIRINPETLALKDVAVHVPVEYGTVGSYPSIEFPSPMFVSDSGDIYLTTTNRGILKLEKEGK